MSKFVFSFCFTFLFLKFFAQNNKHTLEIKTDDKISVHGFSYWQQLGIKSKDTSFVYSLHQANPDVIKNLKAETYTVTVTSLFNHHFHKKIELNKKTPLTKFVGLNAFYTKASEKINLSEKIKLGDTLYVVFSSTQNEKEKLGITKTKIGYTVIQYVGITNEVFQEMGINEATYKSVIKFEIDGKKANSPKANTAPVAEFYTIELNKEITTFVVPSKWDGMNNLKGVLLLVEQK